MKRTWIATLSSIAVMAIAMTFIVQSAEIRAQDKPAQRAGAEERSQEATKGQTFKGKVIDLARHLTSKEKEKASQTPEGASERQTTPERREVADNLPVGLMAQDESLLAKITPGKTVYLVICDPDNERQMEAYRSIRRMAGQDVEVRGSHVEHGGIEAIVIHEVKATRTAQAESPAG